MDFKHQIVYQIWPRSFQDSNGDGIGDLNGILYRLDELEKLGITMIWLSPVYASPNTDYGYDISDYYTIHPELGTMEDFERLVTECRKRKIGIMMDLVANHTSDQHPWFKECLKDAKSPYRKRYIFKTGQNGQEPNNWISCFGGSAWQKDPLQEDNWYLTTFTPHQCDLDWTCPEVRQEVVKIMEFWLKKGVQGFRLDVINTIAKKEGLPSWHPEKKGYQFAQKYMTNLPASHDYIKEIMAQLKPRYDFITVGEGMMADRDACALYASMEGHELDMMFMFDLHLQDCGPLGKYDFRKLYHWTIAGFKKIIFAWQSDMQKRNYWMGNYMNNHDQPRSISRFGNDKRWRKESAEGFALLTLTLRGTPFLYQGEEIGMTNCRLKQTEWRDYEAINIYSTLQTMMHVPSFIAEKIVQRMTRDNARTPVQWNSLKNAGFTSGTSWIKVNPNYTTINYQSEKNDPDGILSAYQKLITLRKTHEALNCGEMLTVLEKHRQILAYKRQNASESFLILINMSRHQAVYTLPHQGVLRFNNYAGFTPGKLLPYQAVLIQL